MCESVFWLCNCVGRFIGRFRKIFKQSLENTLVEIRRSLKLSAFKLHPIEKVPEEIRRLTKPPPQPSKTLEIVKQLVSIPSHSAKIKAEELGVADPKKQRFRLNTVATLDMIKSIAPDARVRKAYDVGTKEYYFWIESGRKVEKKK